MLVATGHMWLLVTGAWLAQIELFYMSQITVYIEDLVWEKMHIKYFINDFYNEHVNYNILNVYLN